VSSWVIRIVGILMMLTALGLSFSRAPDRPVESLVARWAPPPSDFIEVKGQLVHLRDEGPRGDPTPIVLLHGTSASLHTWEGWAHTLKAQRRVISLDLPGFGLTGPFAGQLCARRLPRRHLRTLRHRPAGHAAGAARGAGRQFAGRRDRLALGHAGPRARGTADPGGCVGHRLHAGIGAVGFVLARLPVLRWISEYVLPREVVAQGVANVYGDPSRVSTALVDRYFELTLRDGNRRALGLRLQQLEHGQDMARLAGIRQPTLILWGQRDRLIPPATAQVFERQIAGSRRVVLDALGHVPQEEDAARSLEPVKAFIGWK
jgi:pimeloyl-ACP methyl ester carboxylesterase